MRKGGVSSGRGASDAGPGGIVGGVAAAAIVDGAGHHHHHHHQRGSWKSGSRVAAPKWTDPIRTFIKGKIFFGLGN